MLLALVLMTTVLALGLYGAFAFALERTWVGLPVSYVAEYRCIKRHLNG